MLVINSGIKAFRWIDGQKVCEKTGSMRGGHGGSRESSYGSFASSVCGKNIQARSEDVDTFAVVGKVGTFITESRSTNRDSFLCGSRGIVASITVVITCQFPQRYLACAYRGKHITKEQLTSSDSKVKPGIDGPVNGIIKGSRFATSETHVGNRTFVLSISFRGIFSISLISLGLGLGCGPDNTTNDVRQCAFGVNGRFVVTVGVNSWPLL